MWFCCSVSFSDLKRKLIYHFLEMFSSEVLWGSCRLLVWVNLTFLIMDSGSASWYKSLWWFWSFAKPGQTERFKSLWTQWHRFLLIRPGVGKLRLTGRLRALWLCDQAHQTNNIINLNYHYTSALLLQCSHSPIRWRRPSPLWPFRPHCGPGLN